MQLLLDPANLWKGRPGRLLATGDRKPVALPDAITVLEGDPPVTINVLANDFDREGPVTLISAFAALGTAVAETDGTVTYTPPAGITGFDTVVYEIADTLDQRTTGQVEVILEAAELSVSVTPANTFLATAANGTIDVTVTDPADLAGDYAADLGDLSDGPVNLAPPVVAGTPAEGEILTAKPGLWINEIAGGAVTRAWQWRRGSTDIAGATGTSHLLTAADSGQPVVAVETLSDALGARGASSAPMLFSTGFAPAADPGLIAWWDADDAASLTLDASDGVSAWADQVSGQVQAPPHTNRIPIWGARSLNGRNVIDFDGTDFLTGGLTLPASGDVAFHAVVEIDTVVSQYAGILAVDATRDFQLDAASDTQFDGRLNVSGIGSTTGLSGGPFSGPVVISLVFDASGAGQAEVFVAGAARGVTALTAPLDTNVALYLMTNRSSNAYIGGSVAEVVVTGSIDNRADYQSYLSAKWGAV